ncbi:MAG TPA: NAD(P)/FAD-dependent oxidoreductase [Burkholderiales bacterium]
MAHTPLLNTLVWLNDVARIGAEQNLDYEAAKDALRSRRRFVQGVAATAAMAATPAWVAAAMANPPRIAIIGTGLAGLTCAYRLHKQGVNATVYEAAPRLGGRCVTNRTAFSGLYVEQGGEFIDSTDTEIIELAAELGLTLENFGSAYDLASGEAVYFIHGAPYTAAEVYNDLSKIQDRVLSELAAAPFPTTWNSYTPRGARLDNTNIDAWIQSAVPGGTTSRLGQLLGIAYTTEYGAECSQQSALNLIYQLGTSKPGKFSPLGGADKRYQVQGGNDQLVTRMASALGSERIRLMHQLMRIVRNDDQSYTLDFNTASGSTQVVADYLVLALPFAVMRGKVDYQAAGFDSRKLMAIGKLAMGQNSKLHVEFAQRYWLSLGHNGLSYSDNGYQAAWDATSRQAGTRGVLTNLTGGRRAIQINWEPSSTRTEEFVQLLNEVMPGIAAYATGNHLLSYWPNHRWVGGSYSFYAPGDYTLFGGYEGVRQGNCFFCGEHTSQLFKGTLNGAVESAIRCTTELLEDVLQGGVVVPPPIPEPEPEPEPEPPPPEEPPEEEPIEEAVAGLPSWVPLSGRMKRLVTANTFASVDPCPSDSCTYNSTYNGIGNDMVLRSFSGGIYNPYYSNYGAVVIHGGGHGNYGGNETYVFNLDTLRFTRLDNPTNHPSLTYKSVPGNLWNLTYCEYIDGQPASSHTFDNLAIIPPGKGGGSKGSLLRAISQACGKESRMTGYSHIFNLAAPANRWSRFSINAYNGNKAPPTGACAYDSKRNCVWQFIHQNALVGKLDIATKKWTTISMNRGMGDLRPDSLTAQYYAPRDLVILWAYRKTVPKSTGVWIFNPNSPTTGVQRITLSRSVPPSTSSEVIAGDICTHNGRIYLITPADEDAVFEVTIGTTLNWTVKRLAWIGSAADVAAIGSAIDLVVYTFKRFAYCTKARCFVYVPARGAPVFAFRPPGV